jgi:hypothetical protein
MKLAVVLVLACAPASPGVDGGSDAAAPPGSNADLDECFRGLAPAPPRFIEVQTLTSAGITIRRARTPGDGIAVGETFPYVLIRFGVAEATGARCISQAAQLTYRYGHHNWNDSMEATVGSLVYRLEEKLTLGPTTSSWDFTLTVLEGGTPREGPLPMKEAGCYTLPFDLNGCFLRMRTPAP